jgi:endoribonuclease LACTB2
MDPSLLTRLRGLCSLGFLSVIELKMKVADWPIVKYVLSLGVKRVRAVPRGLPTIVPVEKVSERTTRVLAMNPGTFTLQGTNTYLIGTGIKKILVDTGEKDMASVYVPFLLDTIFPDTKTEELSIILITHRHYDHIGGVVHILQELRSRGKRLPQVFMRYSEESISAMQDAGFTAENIENGQFFQTEGATLRAMYTPGHCNDHVSFILMEDRALLSGDCILGCSSAVFDDLLKLMESLKSIEKLFSVDAEYPLSKIYPGHGPTLFGEKAMDTIRDYIFHRSEREEQLLNALKDTSWMSTWDITSHTYQALPFTLKLAAQLNVSRTAYKLLAEDRVSYSWPDLWKFNRSTSDADDDNGCGGGCGDNMNGVSSSTQEKQRSSI